MKGTLYGIGLGPGDPELMTLKAARLIRECAVIAAPGRDPRKSVAYGIAVRTVPEIDDKEILALDMPMTTDAETLREAHARSAEIIREQLEAGRDVAYLTLGDPSVYCTFSYIQRLLEGAGFPVETVSGVTSFCAAAARLGIPLVEWDEPLHVIPAAHRIGEDIDLPGTCVLMKSAGRIGEVREKLRESGRDVQAVINCGMEGEQICRGVDEIPEDAGYFALIIAKENKEC